ncbi:citrate/2-methylcitrate synthase [Halorientalis halophila]|uniref:citrate/2-methylcitrate synthase n=1 Tax=Halorientalis halophila TaxID=3108499 RepID=UPI00300AACE5
MSSERIRRIGLENVVMADTEITRIDGAAGRLIYRGYDIEDLADNASYEEVAYLLMFGALPDEAELAEFTADLASRRGLPGPLVATIEELADQAAPMTMLRLGLLYLSALDDREDVDDRDLHVDRGMDILAKVPTILAYFDRFRNGREPVEPREDLGHAANFLYMLNGEEPDEATADCLDTCLILPADHGINASTFTARVVTSTQSDIYSAIVGAISAIKGPLHGGASGNVLRMFEEIESPETAGDYIEDMIDRGERVPGFGHRVYETVDPRAVILRGISERLASNADDPAIYEIAHIIEVHMRNEVGIDTNLDYYSAVAYHYLGIPDDLFPLMFCQARVAGWVAQALEQYEDNRLIRPRAEYVGEEDLAYADRN